MSEYLMVPTKVDALFLAEAQTVASGLADFSRLPYFDGARDINPDNPYLSKLLLSPPFNDATLFLGAGIHLHWSLPDSLTSGTADGDRVEFPAVPNRWLVVRETPGGSRLYWIVDSDFLFPAGERDSNSTPYPIPVKVDSHQPPFRDMGRTLTRAHWQARDKTRDEFLTDPNLAGVAGPLAPLTALGYGEPSFAAYYPNCIGIFGFHDADPPADLTNTTYSVFGWYRDQTPDICAGMATNGDLAAKLSWCAQDGAGKELAADAAVPEKSIVYAQVKFNSPVPAAYPDPATPVRVGLGDTPTEALSTLLARDPDFDHSAAPDAPAAQKSSLVLLEEQLEALHLTDQLAGHQLDVGPRFQEARHEKGFTARAGGTIWRVRPAAAAQKAKDQPELPQITLPDDLALDLNRLNRAQAAYDRAEAEISSRRRQLYSAWYQYMLAAYPMDAGDVGVLDVDATRAFIQTMHVAPLQEQMAATGRLALRFADGNAGDGSGSVSGAADAGGKTNTLAANVASAVTTLLAALQQDEKDYVLTRHAAPRFWQPNEPVILLHSALVEASDRHGNEGQLLCPVNALSDDDLPNRADDLTTWLNGRPDDDMGKRQVSQQPWHPFLLEWEVELEPTKTGSNLLPERHSYDPAFITGNFELAENEVDLRYRPGRDEQQRAHCIYNGRSLLTPQSKTQLAGRLTDHLAKRLLADYQAETNDAAAAQPGFFDDEANQQTVIAWYQAKPDDYKDAFTDWVIALRPQLGADMHVLAQALSGFNDALLAQQLVLQLPLAEPLGFPEYQAFTAAVDGLVAGHNDVSPNPSNDFNPIRSGVLELRQLRLVDTFGRYVDIEPAAVYAATDLCSDRREDRILLPPRLTQPARINFRWLSGGHEPGDEVEMNDHPASSAVCGWLVVNNLDGSLQVFDPDGAGLGLFDQAGRWQPAPGSRTAAASVAAVANPHLRRVLRFIEARDQYFLKDLILTLDSAQENIAPENFAQHMDLALLMGRPLAVARASLQLEQQGLAAVNPDVILFRHQVQNHLPGETAGIDQVRLRVRLGEHRQLNDGLVGYWIEGDTAIEEATDLAPPFFTPQAEAIPGVASDLIRTYHDAQPDDDAGRSQDAAALNIELWFDRPALTLTMLVDPIGSVHVTSGVLPTKTIYIPPEQIAAALQQLRVTFFTSPVLTQAAGREVDLPLSPEPGFAWGWLQRAAGGDWRGDYDLKRPPRDAFAAAATLREGWLTLKPAPLPGVNDQTETDTAAA